MKSYTVKQIANVLKTNEETVRRWIRSGKLTATCDSKKSGNIVTDSALNEFIKATPKYATAISSAIASSPLAVSLVVGGLLGGVLAAADFSKDKKVSSSDIEAFLNKKIAAHSKIIAQKNAEIKKLQQEIEAEQKNLEKFKYALDNLDLDIIAAEVNNEK